MLKIKLLVFFIFITFFGFSQEIYYSLSAGYGIQAFKNQVETYFDTESDNATAQLRQPPFSLGQGLYFGLNIGYYNSYNYGFDLGFQYQLGAKQYFHQKTIVLSTLRDFEKYVYVNRFLIKPSFIVRPEPMKITPFFGIGPSVGIINCKVDEFITIDTNVMKKYWKYTGPISVGFHTLVGIDYAINDKTHLIFEIEHISMIYKPVKLDLIASYKNGVRDDDNLQYFEKHFVFTEWKDDPYNQPIQDPDKPVIMNYPIFSVHSFNFLLGARLAL